MAKRKQYRNPPLVEVFCEFSFAPAPDKKQFALELSKFWEGDRKRIRNQFPLAVEPTGPPVPRHRFLSENEKTLLQVGENLLVVNQLPPYHEWERYEPVVVECFDRYTRVWTPTRVDRAAIHYINKIDVPEVDFNLDDYFNLFPVLPEFPGTPATNIALSYEVLGAKEGDIVVTTMRQHPSAAPQGTTFLLQWDYVATGGMDAETQQAQSWLANAHAFLSELFHGTLTDECRRLFD
jgi:uncharacterized protein (TIGR04255 family)